MAVEALAPYHVQLVSLDAANPAIASVAAAVERALEAAGVDVLHDDREGVSPGMKFKDADLLGMPLRVTVGAKGLKDGIVEVRDRRTKAVVKVAPDATSRRSPPPAIACCQPLASRRTRPARRLLAASWSAARPSRRGPCPPQIASSRPSSRGGDSSEARIWFATAAGSGGVSRPSG